MTTATRITPWRRERGFRYLLRNASTWAETPGFTSPYRFRHETTVLPDFSFRSRRQSPGT